MRKLTFGMNVSLDGYIAAPGDDLAGACQRRVPVVVRPVGATSLALYGANWRR